MNQITLILRKILQQRMICIITILYLWAWSSSPLHAIAALKHGAQLFASVSIIIMAVFALIGLIQVEIGKDLVSSLLGQESGFKGLLIAVGCGIIMIGPSYVVFPLLINVRRLGARWAVIAIVLAAWAIKPQMMPIEAQFLGFPFALVRSGLILLLAIPLGLVIEWFMPNDVDRDRSSP